MKGFGPLSFVYVLTVIGVVLIICTLVSPALRDSLNEVSRHNSKNSHVQVLKEEVVLSIINGKRKELLYTKFRIEGHDFFVLRETGVFAKKVDPIHCLDCSKCRGERDAE